MTTASPSMPVAHPGVIGRTVTGGFAGVAGGVFFGVLMQIEGMIPLVAQLVGSQSTAVGWIVHLVISAFIGGAFGLLFGVAARGLTRSTIMGMMWGAVWWVLGGLILMPAFLSMPDMIFEVGAMQWKSLMGHLIFGIVAGFVYGLAQQRHTHE
ncbi:hypothetical protein [Salininema proteolyticum]|uniref:DUF1440 domain-containing protein n=1 Tax=Salininema proteolyticum TaxID=1607685 RepID=A0ABV8U0L9_9ACTN